MPHSTPFSPAQSAGLSSPRTDQLQEFGTLELAQALAERLAISPQDWHRLKSNRRLRACEQTAAALVFLLKENSPEALMRLQQAAGWLDRSISAPPCPTHGVPQSKTPVESQELPPPASKTHP